MTAETDARVQDRAEQTVAVHFVDVRTRLNEIAAENEQLIFDYETPAGEKAARSQIYKLKKINGSIDEIHKAIKRDILVQGRMMDSVKNELRDRVAEMILVHKQPLDEIAERETNRLNEIDIALREITKVPEQIGMTSTLVECLKWLDHLLAIEVTEKVFQERYIEASKLYDEILGNLETYIQKMKADEKQAAEIAELKAKQAERDRIDREKKIADDAAAKAKQDADTVRLREMKDLMDKQAKEKADAEQELIRREAEAKNKIVAAEQETERQKILASKAKVKSSKLMEDAKAAVRKKDIETTTRIEQVKKEVGTEKRRVLTMFTDFLIKEYRVIDEHGEVMECSDALVNHFFGSYPNVE